jgi:hypothetical protein
MKVAVGVRRAVVVDDDVDSFNINATTKDVGCDKDTLFEGLESSVTIYATPTI